MPAQVTDLAAYRRRREAQAELELAGEPAVRAWWRYLVGLWSEAGEMKGPGLRGQAGPSQCDQQWP
jgi:hypothetical protein